MFIKSLTFAYCPQSSTLETNSSTSSTVQSRSDWFFGVLFKLADGDTDLPSSASSGSSFFIFLSVRSRGSSFGLFSLSCVSSLGRVFRPLDAGGFVSLAGDKNGLNNDNPGRENAGK